MKCVCRCVQEFFKIISLFFLILFKRPEYIFRSKSEEKSGRLHGFSISIFSLLIREKVTI